MKIRPLPMTEGLLKIRVNALVMKHSGQLQSKLLALIQASSYPPSWSTADKSLIG